MIDLFSFERFQHLYKSDECLILKAFKNLKCAYGSDSRFYHNIAHISDCLAKLDRFGSERFDLYSTELAIWFHDVVYDSMRSNNEDESALWAQKILSQLNVQPSIVQKVVKMIKATKDHVATTDEEKLLIDIDLSILGESNAKFQKYDDDIRKEYNWVPQEKYREGRLKVLASFIDRENIFNLSEFQKQYEKTARKNIDLKISEIKNK